jgi:exodeoxyribonuclease VII small subunit
MAPAKAKRDVSYKDAMEELEDIVAKVDDRNVDIDDLAKNVKRAHELISICQARIEAVRFEVENVMAGASVAPVVVEIEVEEGELF